MTEIKEGTELFIPAKSWRGGSAYTATVTKVGRKWLSLSNHGRVNKKTMLLDSCDTRQAFLSEAEWITDRDHKKLWSRFQKQISGHYGKPPATPEAIRKAAAALGITLDTVE
jgi:hypothetical protein